MCSRQPIYIQDIKIGFQMMRSYLINYITYSQINLPKFMFQNYRPNFINTQITRLILQFAVNKKILSLNLTYIQPRITQIQHWKENLNYMYIVLSNLKRQ